MILATLALNMIFPAILLLLVCHSRERKIWLRLLRVAVDRRQAPHKSADPAEQNIERRDSVAVVVTAVIGDQRRHQIEADQEHKSDDPLQFVRAHQWTSLPRARGRPAWARLPHFPLNRTDDQTQPDERASTDAYGS